MSLSTEYEAVSKSDNGSVPRVDYDMRKHKVGILITWSILFLSSAASPIILYFALRYAAHFELGTTLGIASAVFGVFSLFSLIKRTWTLTKRDSTCRPLGGSGLGMDYFNWNFIIGFVSITAVVVAGNVLKNIRIYALGLPILLAEVCFQLFVIAIARVRRAKTPFTMSSVAKDQLVRSGVYVLAEDIIAVDAGQGQTYRRQLSARYGASRVVRSLCWEMDLIWGSTGSFVGVGTIVALFVVPNENTAFVLGWTIPWAYAAIMALFTLVYCQRRLRGEINDPWVNQKV